MDNTLFDQNLKLKIKSIIQGLWTLNPDEFYVELKIEAKDKKIYYRAINKNELEAIQTQINVSYYKQENEEGSEEGKKKKKR